MLTAGVVVVEPTGADTELFLKIGETRFTVTLRGRASAKPGERIGLNYDTGAAHLFDAENGLRLDLPAS
ncbi:MAG: hypothetical protein LJE62_08215 [Silicimonas sp.]|jgi:multiple sugar transport system ATP-binding protein|nr:hypothetical protein [Silicimonas sp.]